MLPARPAGAPPRDGEHHRHGLPWEGPSVTASRRFRPSPRPPPPVAGRRNQYARPPEGGGEEWIPHHGVTGDHTVRHHSEKMRDNFIDRSGNVPPDEERPAPRHWDPVLDRDVSFTSEPPFHGLVDLSGRSGRPSVPHGYRRPLFSSRLRAVRIVTSRSSQSSLCPNILGGLPSTIHGMRCFTERPHRLLPGWARGVLEPPPTSGQPHDPFGEPTFHFPCARPGNSPGHEPSPRRQQEVRRPDM